jgi:hypothetical protein
MPHYLTGPAVLQSTIYNLSRLIMYNVLITTGETYCTNKFLNFGTLSIFVKFFFLIAGTLMVL